MGTSILLVEDEATLRELVEEAFLERGYLVESTGDGQRAAELLATRAFDLLVTDIRVPRVSGMELVERCVEEHPETDIIIVTAYATVEQAVEALKLGAYQYLRKPFEMDELLHHIDLLIERRALKDELAALRRKAMGDHDGLGLIGCSQAMSRLRGLIRLIAPTESSVFVSGPSGTGKSLVAHAIHEMSPRQGMPFVVVNCAGVPETLIESHFFGHEPGAFTGAMKRHLGFFEQAHRGTLFLDEIGDISLAGQAKILQAIQDRSFRRVGGREVVKVDVRLVSATNRDIQQLVESGHFRLDLFYRLNVVELRVPPLVERPDDIPMLVEHFLHLANERSGRGVRRFSLAAWSMILQHTYPGNVRELENIVEHAVALCRGEEVLPCHLPPALGGAETEGDRGERPLREALDRFEAAYIRRVLKECGFNRTQAAARLGISRKHLWHKMNVHGIIPEVR